VKKSIVIQSIVILLILVTWNFIHLGYKLQKQAYFEKISEVPILVFSQNSEILDSLKTQLSFAGYVSKIEIETKTEIAEKLISKYELNSIKSVLENHSLPDVMKVFLEGENFDRARKEELLLMLSGTDLKTECNPEDWNILFDKIDFLDKSYQVINIMIIIFTFFITVFMQIHFEYKQDKFWYVYESSGGKYGQRRKHFLISSFFAIFLPAILVYGSYLLLINFSYLTIKIDITSFGLEILVLLISTHISQSILRKRLI